MKIKVNDKIPDYEGKPVREGADELTWKSVFFTALNTVMPTEQMTAEVKSQCYQLTTKIYQTNEPNITPTERTFLLERIKKIYNPLVSGRAEELLNQDEPKPEESLN